MGLPVSLLDRHIYVCAGLPTVYVINSLIEPLARDIVAAVYAEPLLQVSVTLAVSFTPNVLITVSGRIHTAKCRDYHIVNLSRKYALLSSMRMAFSSLDAAK